MYSVYLIRRGRREVRGALGAAALVVPCPATWDCPDLPAAPALVPSGHEAKHSGASRPRSGLLTRCSTEARLGIEHRGTHRLPVDWCRTHP